MTIKVYAVADEVPPTCDYITAGKEYEVFYEADSVFHFVDDRGNCRGAAWLNSAHLDGKNWRRIERSSAPPSDTSPDASFWQAAYLAAIHAGNPEPWIVANIAAKKLEERK